MELASCTLKHERYAEIGKHRVSFLWWVCFSRTQWGDHFVSSSWEAQRRTEPQVKPLWNLAPYMLTDHAGSTPVLLELLQFCQNRIWIRTQWRSTSGGLCYAHRSSRPWNCNAYARREPCTVQWDHLQKRLERSIYPGTELVILFEAGQWNI